MNNHIRKVMMLAAVGVEFYLLRVLTHGSRDCKAEDTPRKLETATQSLEYFIQVKEISQ
jgi:hypothetical protein